MLILVVSVGMSVVFAYLVTYVKDFQLRQGSAIMEMIEIEDVWFIPAENQINITIYNYGVIDVQITSLYIDNSLIEFTNMNGQINLIEIPVQGHSTISINKTFSENTGYHFKLASFRGSLFEREYVSP